MDTNFTSQWSKKKDPTPEELVSYLHNSEHKASTLRKVYWDGVEREIPPTMVLANDGDDYYTQVFRNRSQLNAFIDQLQAVANELWPQEAAS